MSESIWEQLKGDCPELNLRLREVLFSDRAHAVFLGQYLNSRENKDNVFAHLFLEGGRDPGERLNRFLEATFFEHPHIIRTLAAGTVLRGQHTFTYSVTEQTGAPAEGPFAPEEALEFASQTISALRYLHAKNLVYCKLSPDTVAKTEIDWRLTDFSELRVAGNSRSESTLSLAARLDNSPPEATEGIISSAWDVWSFGQTLRKLLHKELTGFRGAVLACLNVNPLSRPSLDQLSSLLRTGWTSEHRSAKAATQ